MSLAQFKLNDKVAIVTGGTGGLGFVMAKALAEAGASVVVTSRNPDSAKSAAETIQETYGNPALGVSADLTVADQVHAMMDKVIDKFGRIDILVNNAGINIRKPLDEYDEESWDLVQDTNLKAPFLCAKAVSKHMKQQKYGRIINISSMLGSVALPERSAYCSSKGGLLQLTKVLALELAPYRITVNSLCPGPFATELNKVVMKDPDTNHFFVSSIPLGRWGNPEELTGAIIYMASDASSFMTGSSITVDGGWTAR